MSLILGHPSTSTAASQLTITWSDRSSNEDGFKVERKTGTTGTYAQIAQVGANVISFIDSTVTVGTTYCYRVRAFNSAGNSAYSNEDCGTAPSVSFTLTVTKAGNGTVSSSPSGISCGSDCSETYTSATSVTLSATPASDYRFSGWSGGGCSGTGTCTLLINTNTSVTATFAVIPTTYTLSVTKTGLGTVTSSPAGITCGTDCSQLAARGSTFTLTATPSSGYRFNGWSGACTGNQTCAVTLNANTSVTATFTTLPTGLVAAYSFGAGSGSTTRDSSGWNNTGTISGATWTTSGKFGTALSFDGVNDRVTVNDATSLDLTTGMTLEAWVYPTAPMRGWRGIVQKEGAGGNVYYLHANSLQNRPATGMRIGSERQLQGTTQVPLNTWTHLAATYDGATQRLYVNGVLVASRAQTGSIAGSGSPLRIGGNSVWGEYFQGRIDEVRIYNRALTAAQITTDMNTAVTP
ncbi:MAG: hypothetical protein HOP18_21795 [Deltaproteobacteria bacterium]|nr:hypothetical protein [Deltaproteobacteria bacterium]